MRVVVCCGGDREHPRCYNNNYEESANSNSKVVLILFRRFGMQLLKHRGFIYSSFSSVARLLLFDIYAPLFSVELVLESSNSVFFTPTITLFVAFVVPLRAAIPALGAFLINVFAAAFAPPP
jgi:hypothetical protein